MKTLQKLNVHHLTLLQPSSLLKPNISPSVPSTSASSAQADLLTSTSSISAPMSDALLSATTNIKLSQRRPKKSSSVEYTTDEEDMIVYDAEEEIESNPNSLKKETEEIQLLRLHFWKMNEDELSEILPSAHTYTPKQIALLEELEQEILDSESCKEELEFCEQLYLTGIDRKKEKIASFRQILGKINAAEYDLNSEAAELIFGWRNLCSAFCDSLTVQNEVFENYLAKFENAKQLMEEQVSRTRVKCRQLLEEFIEGLEDDLKYSVNSFESLKSFINGLEENIDETELSDAQKIVQDCKKCFLGLIETRKKGIHAVNLERKFLIRNYEESNIEKSTVLPSWQERFLLFVGLDKEESTANKKIPLIQGSLMQNSEKQIKSTTETSEAVATGRAKLTKYQDLMQSLIHKSKKQPPYIISSWNDILGQSFLTEKLERLKGGNERKMFQVEKTWDDLLLDVTKIVTSQEKVSALLFTEKETFIQLSSWMNILTEAVDSWNTKIREGLASKAHEITLLKWKSKMKEKEEDFGKRNMPGKRARRHFSQLSEFERGLIIGMKTAGLCTRRVAVQGDRSECAIRNCWEQWT
ncbi:uncharacterized protein TNCV_1582661 [Trichonephila clavipes]|nr:uncharacterized protein TNCV_1582661 [Trichonephila clavipes]